jgi:GNAT superfamily N-acetyltransferase
MLARTLQEAAAAAFPTMRVERLGDWWLRENDTADWWNASVLPHGPVPEGELRGWVDKAEEIYRGRAVFQISPAASPGLDDELAARGYRRDAEISLQTAKVVEAPAGDLHVRISDEPDEAWLTTWLSMQGPYAATTTEPAPARADEGAELAMLRRVTEPSAYASVLDGATVISVGRAVRSPGWTGVFGMATRPEARGRGAAAQILLALASWGGTDMYLQVERRNSAALRLYARAGFTERYSYHYRIQNS